MIKKGNIIVVTYWSFNDALIQTYTLPYVRIIKGIIDPKYTITIVSLEKSPDKNIQEIEAGILNLQLPYKNLGFRAALSWIFQIQKLRRFIKKNSIQTIHAWCTPAGAIGYILSRATGKTLIIDSYEPHAEAMVENGSWKKGSAGFRFLFGMERKMTYHASHLIACTESMHAYALEKYGYSGKLHIKPACVDLDQFHPSEYKDPELLKELGLENKIIGFYAGKFGGIYLEEEVYRFIRQSMTVFGEQLYYLFLTNESREKIEKWCRHFAIPSEKIVTRFVPHNEVPKYMQLADFGITPVKPIPSKKHCSPIKNGEYWACGIPVIITPNISEDSALIVKYEVGCIMDGITDSELRRTAKCIKVILDNSTRNELQQKIRPIAEAHRNFSIARDIYQKIYGD